MVSRVRLDLLVCRVRREELVLRVNLAILVILEQLVNQGQVAVLENRVRPVYHGTLKSVLVNVRNVKITIRSAWQVQPDRGEAMGSQALQVQ